MTGCTEEYVYTFSTAVFMSRNSDFFIFNDIDKPYIYNGDTFRLK